MAKIRHIAYRAEDPEAMAKFFIDAFEMSIAGRRDPGVIDLTDGTLNLTVLPLGMPGAPDAKGIEHIGFSAADNEAAMRNVIAAGGKERNLIQLGEVFYERKFEGPEGIVVDVGHWAGTQPVGHRDTQTG